MYLNKEPAMYVLWEQIEIRTLFRNKWERNKIHHVMASLRIWIDW